MRDLLVFTLAAPLASFGGLAVGERRPSGNRPTKSQVIGLTAAALGIPRSDAARQQALATSLGYAVRVDEPGLPATDFHTAQRAEDVSIRKWVKKNGPLETRRDELACDDIKTMLSRREYRTGVLATIVVWLNQPGPASLTDIRAALERPVFALFAGRKAFPLMLPCRPLLVEGAPTIEAALTAYDMLPNPRDLLDHLGFRCRGPAWLYRDQLDEDNAHAGAVGVFVEMRRDMPETRDKWRFGLRAERVIPLAAKGDAP